MRSGCEAYAPPMPVSLTCQELKRNWTEQLPSAMVELVINGRKVPCRCSPARAPVSRSPTIWALSVLPLPELASANLRSLLRVRLLVTADPSSSQARGLLSRWAICGHLRCQVPRDMPGPQEILYMGLDKR